MWKTYELGKLRINVDLESDSQHLLEIKGTLFVNIIKKTYSAHGRQNRFLYTHTLKTGKYEGCLGFDLNMCLIVNQVQESQVPLALNDSTLPNFVMSHCKD